MLELNPISDNFEFVLPDRLLADDLVNEFQKLIDGRNVIHDKIMEYVEESVQSIGIPDTLKDALQIQGHRYVMHKKPSTNNLHEVADFKVSLKFRMLDAMWNYWLFRVSYFKYITSKELNDNLGNLTMTFFNNAKTFSYTVTFIKCVHLGIEGQEFSYTDEITDAKYFSVALAFDNIKVTVNLPEFREPVTNDDYGV